MSNLTERQIAVGDKVRVHFHPPGLIRSSCEGVVSRVDVTTAEGRFFAVEVEHEVILDREHRIRPGFHDYVRYDCPNGFEGQIEMLATADQGLLENDMPDRAPELRPIEAPDEVARESDAEV